MSTSRGWLNDADSRCFEDRLSRLDWLSDNSPIGEYWSFPGGLLAKSLFEEARYCFVYAQFMATILLSLAFVERTLAALFYEAGRNDLQRASLPTLLREAHVQGLIGDDEHRDLRRISKNRNNYAHFRRPGRKDSMEARAILENAPPYDSAQQDATAAIAAVLKLVAKNAV